MWWNWVIMLVLKEVEEMIHSSHQSEDFRRDNACLSTCFFWKEKASCMTGKGDFCGVWYDQERYHKSQRAKIALCSSRRGLMLDANQ